ncbi:MAG: hypothetical protein ACOC7V_15420, partial [Spirochaetota bacterium]
MVCRRLTLAALIALAGAATAPAQTASSSPAANPSPAASRSQQVTLEFVGAPIADMLVALGRAAGVSIIPDETVTGTASYFFREIAFEEAIHEFAARFNLFVTKEEGIYTVSALRIESGPDGKLSVAAPAIGVEQLLEHLSRASRTPILFDRLPSREIAYYGEALTLEEILAQIATQLPDHSLEQRSGAFVLAYGDRAQETARNDWIQVSGERYSISSAQTRLPQLLRLLFDAAGHEYQLLTRSEPTIGPLEFEQKSFDELLRLVLERGDATHSLFNGVYYIVDAPPQTAAARALVTEVVALDRISASSLIDLLPPEQVPDVTIREERVTGVMTITGARPSVERVLTLVRRLDAAPRPGHLRRIALSSIAAEELPRYLPAELRSLQIVPLPDATGITAVGTAEQLASLERLLEIIDVPEPTRLVVLDHLSVADLLSHLPRSGDASRIVPTSDPHRFFYAGSSDSHERFMRDIDQIDRPLAQIRYHLLVVQYQRGEGLEFDLDLSNSLTSPDGVQALVGSIGNLLSLDFARLFALGQAGAFFVI